MLPGDQTIRMSHPDGGVSGALIGRRFSFHCDGRGIMVVGEPTRSRFGRWAFAWGGWLLVLAGAGALAWFTLATSGEPETQSPEPKPPFAQVGRQDNDAPV
jgi:hypothetical protein